MDKETDYLQLAREAYESGHELRKRRRRYKQFTYGKQWEDVILTPDGESVTEREYARSMGTRPLSNNMIRQMVKCVVGNFREGLHEEIDEVDTALKRRNALDELDSRALEEFLISGCAIQRVVDEHRMDGSGVWVDNVSPEEFFINAYRDPRGTDIELVGMLHSMSRRELLMRFGRGSSSRALEIGRIYDAEARHGWGDIGDERTTGFDKAPAGRCRVIEVWTLESRNILKCHDSECAELFCVSPSEGRKIAKLNAARQAAGKGVIDVVPRTTMRWHCRYFAPTGELLDEMDSPYAHGMHPFVVKMYPLIDGEVHSFVEDVVDQQKYINRLITLMDHILGVSAKGVLLFPMELKPDGMTWREIGDMWANTNTVIPYCSSATGAEPKQIINNGANMGVSQLLDIELKLFEQISGVSGALQGRLSRADSSAALFEAQTRNSTVALRDLLDSFHSFRQLRNAKINFSKFSH